MRETAEKKVALITGVTGQDGSYLAEFLLENGYEVHGVIRRSSVENRERIEQAREEACGAGKIYKLHYGDLADASGLSRIVAEVRPHEVYNLAAQSHVGVSFVQPEYTCDINATGTLRLLEAVRVNTPAARVYQAGTAELYGKVVETPQRETTPFYPRSPYAVSKLYAYWAVRNYREAYGMHASNGILFNHESPRRGEKFVTRKITIGLARRCAGSKKPLSLGNLDARRDWGFAGDYVEMMWLMLQQDEPGDYVAATGENHSVREFVDCAAAVAGFEIQWEGQGIDEVGRDRKSGEVLVEVNPEYFRPSEVDRLLGDPTKAKTELKWEPKVTFRELVELMMRADLKVYGA